MTRLSRWTYRLGIAALVLVAGSCSSSTEPAEVGSIEFASATVSMASIGGTQQLQVTVFDQRGRPMNAAGVQWDSEDDAIVSVSQQGLATAVSNGTVDISASLDGVTASVEVTVNDVCLPSTAAPLSLGLTALGVISAGDCVTNTNHGTGAANINYDWYQFTIVAGGDYIMEMSSDVIDTWLALHNGTTLALIEEHDDIVSGTITNSRIVRALAPGTYLLRATTFGPADFGNYTIRVRASAPGVPSEIVQVTGEGQVAAPGVLATAPTVRVLDDGGLGVPGVTVDFATVPGVGSITGASAVTDANGNASVGSWTIVNGPNVLSATAVAAGLSGNPVIFSASGRASSLGFDVDLRFVTMPTATQLQTFGTAAARWAQVISGDLASVDLTPQPAGTCNSASALDEVIDDVLIIVRLEPIDGAGQVLGSAGPCFIRTSNQLPLLGTMRFDTADLDALEQGGQFGNVILHEMGHVLGIGTVWATKNFLINPSPNTGTGLDTHFNGANAITAFNTVGGNTYTGGAKVPVENTQGGAGTRNSHWREGVLQNELMTGFLNSNVANPLSLLTVQQMLDLGYTVNAGAADAFSVVTSLRAADSAPERGFEMKNDVRTGPIYRVDATGRVEGAPSTPQTRNARKRLR